MNFIPVFNQKVQDKVDQQLQLEQQAVLTDAGSEQVVGVIAGILLSTQVKELKRSTISLRSMMRIQALLK